LCALLISPMLPTCPALLILYLVSLPL
jgi:hypothetical protein